MEMAGWSWQPLLRTGSVLVMVRPGKAFQDGMTGFCKAAADLHREAREALAQVKIRGMDQSQIGHLSSPRAANPSGLRLTDIR